MTTIAEQKAYLKEFTSYTNKILSSKKESRDFLIRAGIHTKTGRLTKQYKSQKITHTNSAN